MERTPAEQSSPPGSTLKVPKVKLKIASLSLKGIERSHQRRQYSRSPEQEGEEDYHHKPKKQRREKEEHKKKHKHKQHKHKHKY